MSILCRMGSHHWYGDSAMFRNAERCSRCEIYRHERDGELLELERSLWDQVPKELTTNDKIGWVYTRLYKP